MPDYRITWEIDFAGSSPKAALEAMMLEFFQGEWPSGIDHFVVTDEDGNDTAINYLEDEDDEPDFDEMTREEANDWACEEGVGALEQARRQAVVDEKFPDDDDNVGDDLCDQCGESGIVVDHTDDNGDTVCVRCARDGAEDEDHVCDDDCRSNGCKASRSHADQDLCDQCGRSGVEIVATDDDGKTTCVFCEIGKEEDNA